jgi:hypothetical protein
MTKRDFLAVEDWSPGEIENLLELAVRVRRGEVPGGLEDRLMALVFMDPSLRTRASFEAAMYRHGGHAMVEVDRGGRPRKNPPPYAVPVWRENPPQDCQRRSDSPLIPALSNPSFSSAGFLPAPFN